VGKRGPQAGQQSRIHRRRTIRRGMSLPERTTMRAHLEARAATEHWPWPWMRCGMSQVCRLNEHGICQGETHNWGAGCLCECHDGAAPLVPGTLMIGMEDR
jgi:hypothetical protein